VKIVWDEPKRLANIAKHDGLDFADLDETFFERSVIVPGKGNRLIAVGRLANGVVVVVFVALGAEGLSIISMRRASRKERNAVSDNPELTDEQMSKAKPFAEALPELAASIRRGRGPNKAPTKKLVSLRLSGQVIEKYKAGGPGWQSRIDQDLRRINKIK
jgi:uncharacterized DUF497 family protein